MEGLLGLWPIALRTLCCAQAQGGRESLAKKEDIVSDSRDDQEEEIMKGVDDTNKLMLPFAISMAQIDLFGAAVADCL